MLLLGVGHDDNTTIHLAEMLAGVQYRRHKEVAILQDGVPTHVAYGEIDHCCQNFQLVDAWLDAEQLRRNETVFLHPLDIDEECDEARASRSSSRLPPPAR